MKTTIAIVLFVLLAFFLLYKNNEQKKLKKMNDTFADALKHEKSSSNTNTDTFFSIIYGFPNGIMAMERDHKKQGLYDSIHLKVLAAMKYDEIGCFAGDHLINFKQNNKHGFLDTAGNEIIPAVYDYATSFSEGFAVVKLNGKWGYIDKKNNIAIPIKYEAAFDFYGDRAAVKSNAKWGFINHSGKYAIEPKYDDMIWYFSEEHPKAKMAIKNRYILIDKNGKFLGDTDGDL
jgi:hypothetical protein